MMTRIWQIAFSSLLLIFIMIPGQVSGASQKLEPRIIGGREATNFYPWMAVLVFASEPDVYDGFFCGGSLIAANWVATAAHCVETELPSELDVVLGVRDLKQDLANGIGQRLGVKRIVIHSQYDAGSSDFDIALLELQEVANDAPIPVYSGQDTLVGQEALILGWGNTQRRGWPQYPAVLQEAFLPIVANTVCATALAPEEITDNMLCAGYAKGGTDTCQGDSGGPLLVNLGEYQLAGITSWGIGCGRAGKYGVYTRVANFSAFIQDSQHRDYFACADVNGDSVVDAQDQNQKRTEVRDEFRQWLQECWSTQADCGDVNGDGQVNNTDRRVRRQAMNNQYFYWQQSCWYPEQTTPAQQ
ncbi:MAG: serine protease [Candidatus Competibacteraceae bacterium]|nr:serine protease [Candidatus Competibacteraceae bacterium]MCP5126310.1 serine protease [Gammaproteobacteria bacterium]